MKDTKWGVIQELKVEADTRDALFGAMYIVAVEYSEITHYQELTFDVVPLETWYADENEDRYEEGKYYGAKCLVLHPYSSGNDISISKLPFPLEGAEEITQFVETWLKRMANIPNMFLILTEV